MYTFLVVVISLLAVFLSVIILIQSGKGGGLAASFGGASSSTDSFMGGRQAANVLTKATWTGGGLYLFLALVLAILSSQGSNQAPRSILRDAIPGQTQLQTNPTSILETPPPDAAADPSQTPGEVPDETGAEEGGGGAEGEDDGTGG